ncbi:MAG TPA: hypothetical protein VMI15_08500 [Burkholderiales bacterium]|nr:hypothetical protein [Burkholderiales bacterium]
MSGHLQDELGKLLDGYDERRRGDLEREHRAKEADEEFLRAFAELRREVIRPVFEAAGALLEARGHRYSIAEQEFALGDGGQVTEAAITMRVVASGTRAPLHEDRESLSIATRHYNKTVWINSGEAPEAGGLAGAKGAYALDRVTRQLVEEELLAFVARVMAR